MCIRDSINEVLDMSKIESGNVSLSENTFLVSDTLNTVMQIIRSDAESKEQQIVLRSDLRHDAVHGDFMRVQQILLNLLSNAVKYTGTGGHISLTAEERVSGRSGVGCFEFTVEDDGSKRFESRIIPAEGKPLARAYDLLLPLEKRVQTWLDTPAGHLDLPLVSEDHLKAALNGSDLANFINTVQLEASGAQIASSALPNEFKGLPTEVTIRDVVSTYIYTNTLVVLEMTRPALKQYIERSAAYFDHDEDGNLCIADEFLRPKVQHYNYDFFSGIHYTIDARNPVGRRVTSIVLDGRELGEDEPVTVCVNSYRFCGTGGYDMLPRQKVAREVLTDVADAMIDYITSHPNIHVDTEKYCTIIG